MNNYYCNQVCFLSKKRKFEAFLHRESFSEQVVKKRVSELRMRVGKEFQTVGANWRDVGQKMGCLFWGLGTEGVFRYWVWESGKVRRWWEAMAGMEDVLLKWQKSKMKIVHCFVSQAARVVQGREGWCGHLWVFFFNHPGIWLSGLKTPSYLLTGCFNDKSCDETH